MAEQQNQFDGLDILSGDLTVASGNLAVSKGNVTVTAGTTALLGAILQAGLTSSTQGGTGAAVTFTTGAVINRKLPTGGCTGAILAAGTVNGQIIVVSNLAQNTAFSITFDVPATSNVWDDGTNPQVIKAGTAKMFYWDTSINTTGAWVAFAPFAG